MEGGLIMAKILQFPEPSIPELVDELLELRQKRRDDHGARGVSSGSAKSLSELADEILVLLRQRREG